MKSVTAFIVLTATGWATLCAGLTAAITHTPVSPASGVVWGTLFLLPLLLHPLSRFITLFRKRLFVLQKKKQRRWVHLNPWISTGQPGLSDISRYWSALTDMLHTQLATSSQTLVLSSHLLSSRRITRLKRHFSAKYYQCHILSRPVGSAEHAGLVLETLLKEWRWFTPSPQCGVLLMRKRNKRQ